MVRTAGCIALVALIAAGCASHPRGYHPPPPPLVDDKLYECNDTSTTDGKTVNATMDCTLSLQADPVKFRTYVEQRALKFCTGLSHYIVTDYHETAPPLGGDAAHIRHVEAKIQCQ